jgi:O-antigen/teichoic acid export membrane protein
MLNRYVPIYLVAHLGPAAIGFIALTAYTRLLSPVEYGIYVVGMSIAGILAAVFFAWIRLSVSRYQATSADVDFRGTAIVAYGLTVAAIACVVPAGILLIHPDVDLAVLAASVFMALTLSAFEIGQEFRRANLRPFHYATVAVSRSALGFGIGLVAIEMGWGGFGLLAAVAISFLIGALLNIVGGGARIRLGAFYQRDQLTRFGRYGLPLAIGGLSFALYSASDRLVVAYLSGQEAAGQFGVAADLARQFVVILASSVASATFPVVFRTLTAEGVAATRERLKENAELLLAIIAPVAVWLALAADQVAGTLVGVEFRASVSLLLPVLAAARLLGAFNQFYLQISFQLSERPLLPVIQETFILVLSIALMFPLVAKYGLMGAAVATLITEAAGLLVGILLSRHAFTIPVDLRRLAGVFASATVMAGAIYAAKVGVDGTGLASLSIVTAAGGLAYVASVWLLDVAHIRSSMTSLLRLRAAD